MTSILDEINRFSKSKLKPVSTKISYLDGRQFIKNGLESEEKEIRDDEKDVDPTNSCSSVYWSRFNGYIVDLLPDFSIDEIIPRLFLGGDDVALSRDILDDKMITHILNLTTNVPNKFEPDIIYKQIKIYDLLDQEIIEYFEQTFKFINDALNNENNSILVHCNISTLECSKFIIIHIYILIHLGNAGVSRSSSFVIAYLLQKRLCKTYDEAYRHVKSKRSKIFPNDGFVRQLKKFEIKLSETFSKESKF
jgi:protein-tyrosine phosphatase